MKFTLTTDTSCDVFCDKLTEDNIPYISLTYTISGVTQKDDFSRDEEYVEFYNKVMTGSQPTTSQINAFLHEEFFDEILSKNGGDLVHLSLSSGLSATYSGACIAAENSMKKFPNSRIFIIDTLSATQGHGYLLDEAKAMRDSGKTAEETAIYINSIKHKLQHWLLVDDLMHLKRGGRISGISAYIGTVLNIKPIIAVDDLGKLSVAHKAKGVKQSLKYFVQMLEKYGDGIEGGKVYIASGNCRELAEELKEMILGLYNCEVKIGWIGPIIGAHTGSNSLGMVFLSTQRIKNNS